MPSGTGRSRERQSNGGATDLCEENTQSPRGTGFPLRNFPEQPGKFSRADRRDTAFGS